MKTEEALSYSIRNMNDSDLPFIRKGLAETNWQDIPEDQRRFLIREEVDKRIFEDFERYMKTERFKFRVFTAVASDGNPVGYVSIGENSNPAVGLPFGALLDFWVAPEHRSKGVGNKLLDHALDEIRKRGYTHASILVSASNERAVAMYEKRRFYQDRIVMVKPLRS